MEEVTSSSLVGSILLRANVFTLALRRNRILVLEIVCEAKHNSISRSRLGSTSYINREKDKRILGFKELRL